MCFYLLTKNNEINDLTQKESKNTKIGKMVDINTHNTCMNELNNLKQDLLETQEQNANNSMKTMSDILNYAVGIKELSEDLLS